MDDSRLYLAPCPTVNPKSVNAPNIYAQVTRGRKEQNAGQRSEACLNMLISRADAGERLRRHRVDGLVLGNAQGILIANQGLGMQLE